MGQSALVSNRQSDMVEREREREAHTGQTRVNEERRDREREGRGEWGVVERGGG